MNKKVYIRYENVDGKSWATSAYGLNLYSTEPNSTIDWRVPAFKDYSNLVQQYRRSDVRNQLFKTVGNTPSTFLSIGVPTGIDGQTVSINSVDTTAIFEALSAPEYNSVHFAFNVLEHPEGAGDLDVVTKSTLYARNIKTGLLENCITKESFDVSKLSLSLWFTVYRIGNTDIYYMVVNPELLAVISNVDGTYEGVDYRLIGTEDSSFATEILNPSVTGGKLVGTNIIFATSDTLVIDVIGNSILHGYFGEIIPKTDLPTVDLSVDSSVAYTVDNNIITLDLTGNSSAFVNYKWITGSFLDFTKEQLIKNFVIIK